MRSSTSVMTQAQPTSRVVPSTDQTIPNSVSRSSTSSNIVR